MSNSRTQRIQELLDIKERRLHQLQKQEATQCLQTPPAIKLEIEDLNRDIAALTETLTYANSIASKIKNQRPRLYLAIVIVIGIGTAFFHQSLISTQKPNIIIVSPENEEKVPLQKQHLRIC